MTECITNKVLKLREASGVRRCHTLPHVGEYTVGKHSYDALVLLMLLHPEPSLTLIRAVTFHDCAERWTGDLPCPATWQFKGLRQEYELAQTTVMQENQIPFPGRTMTVAEWEWLHAVDKLELWLWAQEQANGWGNTAALVVLEKLNSWFVARTLPAPVTKFLADYRWRPYGK